MLSLGGGEGFVASSCLLLSVDLDLFLYLRLKCCLLTFLVTATNVGSGDLGGDLGVGDLIVLNPPATFVGPGGEMGSPHGSGMPFGRD